MGTVTAAEFAAKFSTKKDVWRFLTGEVKWYLPRADTVTIWHLRDMASGKRSHIKSVDVKFIEIPHYEGLTIEEMLEKAEAIPDVMKVLPIIQKEREKLPRAYIGNVMYTIVGKPFADWVDLKVKERHAKVKAEREMQIEMD